MNITNSKYIGLNIFENSKFILTIVFFFSGFSALIYQIAWQRILTVQHGVGSISIALIVSIYMLGLGFGSLLGGRLSENKHNTVYIYFFVELLIAVFGLLSLPFLKLLSLYSASNSYLISMLAIFIFLCIPTTLMGMTLPLITKIFHQQIETLLHSLSWLYFINTIGAAFGSFITSYLIISFFGLDISIFFAVGINFALALLILLCSKNINKSESLNSENGNSANNSNINIRTIYLFVFVTGFIAIGYEVLWIRVVSTLLKASPYAFSTIIAIYLTGIALGSLFTHKFISKRELNTLNWFFVIQALLSLSVLITFMGFYYLNTLTSFSNLTRHSFFEILHPNFDLIFSTKTSISDYLLHFDFILWPIFFIFIPAILIGASFPLIATLNYDSNKSVGKVVGDVYFFLIIGNTLGGLITGFILLPYLGTSNTTILFAITGFTFICFFAGSNFLFIKFSLITLLSIILFLLFPNSSEFYKTIHTKQKPSLTYNFEEGIDGVVVSYSHNNTVINYINGLPHGGRPNAFFNYEAIESATYAKNVQNVLIIGLGTGLIAETILKSDEVLNVTIVELNEALIKNLLKIPVLNPIFSDKRVNIVHEDGRRFLSSSDKQYDLILLDPLRSTTAYSNNLYSKEFFELTLKHLKPGGVVLNWRDEKRILIKTFIDVFPYYRIYEAFNIGSNKPLTANPDRYNKIYSQLDSIDQHFINLFKTYEKPNVGDAQFHKEQSKNYLTNTDLRPYTEYYLGQHFRKH